MRIGTPGFVPARLVEGREARGFTQTHLAELTGIKPQSISHYEQGRQSPSPEGLSLLATALALPERFFLKAPPDCCTGGVFFRQHSPAQRATAKVARLKAERRLSWLRQTARYLRQFVSFPDVVLPARTEDIEQAAREARIALGLNSGPCGDLIGLLEAAGWVITRYAADPELGPSYSHWADGFPYLALAIAEGRASWVQYNIAHELGHMILHRDWHDAGADEPDYHRRIDAEADHFAGAFLLPARTFAGEVWAPSINALLSLKKDWCCPMSVMVRRCGELGLFDADQLRRARINLVRRGWNAAEPREMDEPERPQLLARTVELLIREGRKDRHSILIDLGLGAADIEELCGLPLGYLSAAQTHLHDLRLLQVDSPDIVITQV